MKAEVRGDTSTRQIDIEIADGPQVDGTDPWQAPGSRVFLASQATIRVVNGETRRITVSGGLLRKDGSASPSVRIKRSWSTTDLRESIEHAPAWVRELFYGAPQGVTTWELVAS